MPGDKMKNHKGPKLGKRALSMLKKEEQVPREPITAEEFLEQGSVDEESGDRWLGSDLSKSLRFYQKAHTSYLRSIELQSSSSVNLDSYYNSSRLLFQVYSQYFKTDGVNIYDLTNVNEALTQGPRSVVQPLANVIEAHETAIKVAKQWGMAVPSDLVFNTAVVYTEALEVEQENPNSNFAQLLEITRNTQQMFTELLDQQTSDFQQFLHELQQLNHADGTSPAQPSEGTETPENSKEEEFTSGETVQPTDIYETVMASYKLSQAILENISDEVVETMAALDTINPFVSRCDEIAQDLVVRFSEASEVRNDMLSNLSQSQVDELKVARTYIKGLGLLNAEDVFELWDDSQLPHTAERYMTAADNIQGLLDRSDFTLAKVNQGGRPEHIELLWNALTKMGEYLKKSQALLEQTLRQKKSVPSGVDLGLGSLIAQVSEVYIARSDIELQRSQIEGHAVAQKSGAILLQNAKTLLKNAMNIANTSGGLRERIAEKHQREKKKVDAVIRMCVLEGKTSTAELDQILGRNKWTNELPGLQKLGFFDMFGVQNIAIPSDL